MISFSNALHLLFRSHTIFYLLYYSFFLLLFCRCNPSQEQASTIVSGPADSVSYPVAQAKEITLILKNFPALEKQIKTVSTYVVWHLNSGFFYSDDLSMKDIDIDTTKISKEDTITLIPENDKIIVRCRYNYMDYYEYLVRKGDTLLFTYQDGYPIVALTNRRTLLYDFTFDSYIRKQLRYEKYAPITKYKEGFAFIDFRKKSQDELKKKVRMFEAQTYKQAVTFLYEEQRLLDSLKATHNISPDVYSFYKTRAQYLVHWLNIKEDKLTIAQVSQLLQEEFPANTPAFYRRQFVESVADKYMVEQVDGLDLKDGVNRDYRQAYKAIKESTLFNEKDRNHLLTREMQRIADTFSQTDFHKFFTLYNQDVTDSMLVKSMKEKYALKFDQKSTETKSIVLMSKDNNQIEFGEIKRRYKGKVLYVDFWASWCAPCREVMPQSIALKESLKDNNIVFVYLSIDQSVPAWLKASLKEGLDSHSDNYLIVNASTSEFMKKQQIQAIPRYMIFNKEGKLAYANAPSVKSKELKSILMELAK